MISLRRAPAWAGRLAVLFCGLAPGLASAAPSGPDVVHGAAEISVSSTTTLVRNDPGTIINWQAFGLQSNELARFVQSGVDSAVLNRVVGTALSEVHGRIESNGQVFLINPNGIVLGAGAEVDTAAFIASTLPLDDAAFLAAAGGDLQFGTAPDAGALVNSGTLVARGGSLVLVAPSVSNHGRLEADRVVLAAGQDILVQDLRTPAIQWQLSIPKQTVLNTGEISAGSIRALAGSLLQHGTLQADRVEVGPAGEILLVAGGDLELGEGSSTVAPGGGIHLEAAAAGDGTLWSHGLVSAADPDAAGGSIALLGTRVGVTGRVAADGASAGGSIRVGGSISGAGPLPNALATWVADSAWLSADATGTGDGGSLVLFAQDVGRFHGSLSARGGPGGGNGGFIETSSHGFFELTGTPDASAPAGRGGTWLIDPPGIDVVPTGTVNITDTGVSGFHNFIVTDDQASLPAQIEVGTLFAALQDGVGVVVDATADLGQDPLVASDININAAIDIEGNNVGGVALTFIANNAINVNQPIFDSDPGGGDEVNLTFTAPSINIFADIDTDGGSLDTSAGLTTVVPGAGLLISAFNWNADEVVFGNGTVGLTLVQGLSASRVQFDSGLDLTLDGQISALMGSSDGAILRGGNLALGLDGGFDIIGASATVFDGTLATIGDGILDATVPLELANGTQLTVLGLLEIRGDTGIVSSAGAPGTLVLDSVFSRLDRTQGTGTAVLDVDIVSPGTLAATTGILDFTRSVTSTGVISGGAGTTLRFRGGLDAVDPDGSLAGDALEFLGVVPTTMFDLGGASATSNSLRLDGGVINYTAASGTTASLLVTRGTLNVLGGSLQAAGNLDIGGAGTLLHDGTLGTFFFFGAANIDGLLRQINADLSFADALITGSGLWQLENGSVVFQGTNSFAGTLSIIDEDLFVEATMARVSASLDVGNLAVSSPSFAGINLNVAAGASGADVTLTVGSGVIVLPDINAFLGTRDRGAGDAVFTINAGIEAGSGAQINLTDAGSIVLNAGAAGLVLAPNNITAVNIEAVTNGVTINTTGDVVVPVGTEFNADAPVTLNLLDPSAQFSLTGGIVTHTRHDFTVRGGQFDWNSGTLRAGVGDATVFDGTSIDIEGTRSMGVQDMVLDGGSLITIGTLEVPTGTGALVVRDGGAGGGSIVYDGGVLQTGAGDVLRIQDGGRLEVRSGTLALAGADVLVGLGSLELLALSTLDLGTGTVDLGDGSLVTGAGTLLHQLADLQFTGTNAGATLDLTLAFENRALGGSGILRTNEGLRFTGANTFAGTLISQSTSVSVESDPDAGDGSLTVGRLDLVGGVAELFVGSVDRQVARTTTLTVTDGPITANAFTQSVVIGDLFGAPGTVVLNAGLEMMDANLNLNGLGAVVMNTGTTGVQLRGFDGTWNISDLASLTVDAPGGIRVGEGIAGNGSALNIRDTGPLQFIVGAGGFVFQGEDGVNLLNTTMMLDASTVGADVTVNGFLFSRDATLDVSLGGNRLVLEDIGADAGFDLTGSAALSVTGGTFDWRSGDLTLTGTATAAFTGTTHAYSGGGLRFQFGDVLLDGMQLEGGELVLLSGVLDLGSGGRIDPGAKVTVDGGDLSGPLDIAGLLDVFNAPSGVRLDQGGSLSGTIQVDSAQSLVLAGTPLQVLDGGTLSGPGSIVVQRADVVGTGQGLVIAENTLVDLSFSQLDGTGRITLDGILYTEGNNSFAGELLVTSTGELEVAGFSGGDLTVGTLINDGLVLLVNEQSFATLARLQVDGQFLNRGLLQVLGGTSGGDRDLLGSLDNQGTFQVSGTALTLDGLGGEVRNTGLVQLQDGATVDLVNSTGFVLANELQLDMLTTLDVAVPVQWQGGRIAGGTDGAGSLAANAGLSVLGGEPAVLAAATISASTLDVAAGAQLVLDSGAIAASNGVTVAAGGVLGGNGTLTGNVTNNGALAPGLSPGTLSIDGDFTQTATGVLDLDVDGSAPFTPGVDHDLLEITGTASFDGTLRLTALPGFTGGEGDSLQLVTYGAAQGAFADEVFVGDPQLALQTTFGATGLTSALTAVAPPPTEPPPTEPPPTEPPPEPTPTPEEVVGKDPAQDPLEVTQEVAQLNEDQHALEGCDDDTAERPEQQPEGVRGVGCNGI